MTKIILVEDNPDLREKHQSYLTEHGYDVTLSDEASATSLVCDSQPDLVIISLSCPSSDGLGLCRQLRPRVKSKLLFLTPLADDIEHVAALELGADDFIQQSISMRVLLARIRMLLRRMQSDAPLNNLNDKLSHSIVQISDEKLVCGNLVLNNKRKSCVMEEQVISLTASEFDLLWLLASKADEVLSREYLVKVLRGVEYDGFDRSVDNKIATLRKKLGDMPSQPRRIITVRSKGYAFMPDCW